MKKIFATLVCIAFISLGAKAVMPNWAWEKNFNAHILDIEYHNNYLYTAGLFSDSAFIFGNANIGNNGGYDAIIMKWDTLGNLIWATSIWGSGHDTAVNIKVNAAGELIVAGNTSSSTINVDGNILTSNGGGDVFIAKYDLNGNYIDAYIFGTAGNESVLDMCTDHANSIYIAGNGNVKKYSNAGVFFWQRNLPASKLEYSKFDSTLIVSGLFMNTLTVGNFNVVAVPHNGSPSRDVFVTKISLSNNPVWLANATNIGNDNFSLQTYIHEQTGRIYTGSCYMNLSGDNSFRLQEVSPNGGVIDFGIALGGVDMFCLTISGKDNLISIGLDLEFGADLFIYDINTYQQVKQYSGVGNGNEPNSFQCFRGIYSIYTHYGGDIDFGKIGDGSLIGIPSNQTIEACAGALTTLTGNITGGVGPLTYSWLPVTGLNNTNTNTVHFTAVSNISYTLTVTDGINIAKDTFNVIVQNPIPAANITSQFPTFCDTMQLYSNNGVIGDWYQFLPGNPPNNQWQLIATDTVVTIYAAGTYSYATSNACNSVADTIVIPGTLTVTANASSDSICAGQAVTLYGSGALNYTWTGAVVNNVPFSPIITQTYIVTGTDANGCTNTSYITITINSTSDTTNTSICAAQTPYMWNAQSLDSTGTYTANFTNIYGCDSTEVLNLTVSPCIVCVPDFTINYSPFYNALTESQSWITTYGTVLILAGTSVKLDANANSFVSLNPGFKAEHGSVFVAKAYNGCTAGAPQLPNAKIFNGETYLSTTADEIVLYPNPTSGMIHIQHDEKLTGIQIFDMVGKLVINQKCNGETETNIDLSNLPNGVYHVKAVGCHSIKVVKNN